MRPTMQRILRTSTFLLLRRIAWLYVLLMLCRVVFYLYNAALIGPLAWSELGALLRGALLFDTASICYADGVFILLSLLPLHLREKQWYRNLLLWYYVVVNALLVVVVNLSDAVYFHYTQKRFTADEIFFADNDNSLLLVGKFLVENWWLALLGAGFIWLLIKGYGRRIRPENILHGWLYYVVSVVIFGIGAALCIAGMRGGITRQTRPITLSNATLYTPESNKANLLLSNPFCILRTVSSSGSIHYVKYFTEEELAQYFTPVHEPAENAAVDLSGRNVLIFIMESMSAEHSALLHPELYPAEGGGSGRVHAVPRFADAYGHPLPQDVRQRHTVDSSHAVGAGQYAVVPDTVRADAPIAGRKPTTTCHSARYGLFDHFLLRVGTRLDGIRGIRPFGRYRPAREPRGLRSPSRQR